MILNNETFKSVSAILISITVYPQFKILPDKWNFSYIIA